MDRNLYSNIQSQKPHLQNQRKGCTAEEYSTEEEDDERVIADPHYEYFLENLRPYGKSYVLDIIEDNVFVKYHDESSTPEAVTDCEAENANHAANAPVNYVGKCRGRKPKGPKLHADKSSDGSGNHVASEAQKHESNHYGKHRGRQPKGEKLSADTNPNGSTSCKHVASELQKHMHYHEAKRRGRRPKEGPKLHDTTKNTNGNNNHVASEAHKHAGRHRVKRARKNVVTSSVNPNYEYFLENLSGNGSGSHVASEAQRHQSNRYGKRRGRKPKVQKLSAGKNPNGSTSSKHVASEPQKHMHYYEAKRRGRKPKEGPKLHATTENTNSNNNHVASEAHKHAGRHRVKRARKSVIPSSVNPDYEYFLENLRPYGKSYVLDIIEDNVFVKYHDESSIPEAVTDLEAENANHVTNAPVNYAGRHRGRKPKDPKLHADKSGNGSGSHIVSEAQKHESNRYGKRRHRRTKGQKLSACKNPNGSTSSKNVASESQKHVHNQEGKRRGRKPKEGPKLHATTENTNGDSNRVASEAHKHAGRHSVKRARRNVNHTDSLPCIATRVKEENEDYDDDAPSIRRPVQDPVLNVEHFWDNDEANARKLTKYREKLMEELKMPYCEEECERLLKDITVRKPVQGKRELRRIKIYEENYVGKSLLDHYIDLKKKIDSVRDDHPKVLNLLRGFFYWLKNLSHEGAFMPWRDPSCLDVLS